MNVLITGTSSGVGAGLAAHYLENGNNVFGISRKANSHLIMENFRFLSQDLSDFAGVENKLPVFLKGNSTIDLIILNAGILNEIKDLKDTSIDEIQHTMNINVWANKVLIDVLFRNVGNIKQIVAISSGASVNGSRGWNAYSLSKATLNMLINLYSKENTETHFCALAPGLINTNMQDYIYNLPDDDKYPVVEKLKKARGTDLMPDPKTAAGLIDEAIEKVKRLESGSFADIREL
jgi:NAD(P)-dependent dehydrogenase (short-subunit alcohol dehydrogenase family)